MSAEPVISPLLKPGAGIAVIAPAGIPKQAELAQGIALLEDWGYHVIEGEHLYAQYRYNAGTVADRTADLTWALTSPDIDAVWLARGGYGCIHCLADLPREPAKARVLVGNSDATSLLSALHRRGHTHLIHGPMLESLAARVDGESRGCIRQLLTTSVGPAIRIEQLCGPSGSVSGRLVGGNLTVLASIAGTPWAMNAVDSIVLLEDIGEAAYRLDRSIMQLLASGGLAGARAIVFGEFFRCALPQNASFSIEDVMKDLLAPLGIPIFFGAAIGHGSRNLAWRYAHAVTIQDGAVNFAGPPVLMPPSSAHVSLTRIGDVPGSSALLKKKARSR
jgi:muramoyltetrapeptide carboxypeptidase